MVSEYSGRTVTDGDGLVGTLGILLSKTDTGVQEGEMKTFTGIALAVVVTLVALAGCASDEARAVRTGDIEAIRDYLRNGDVNAPQRGGETLLMIAAGADQHESVSLLIDSGADVRTSDNRGRTALMHAAAAGSSPIVRLLLEHGAVANVQDYSGRSALVHAADAGRTQIVDMLVGAGADPSLRTDTGRTALFFAVDGNYYAIAESLLRIGADANAMDNDGLTPIFGALSSNRASVLDLLLSYDADPTVTTSDGETLVILAAAFDNPAGLEILLQAAPQLIDVADANGWTAVMRALDKSAESRSRLNRSATLLLRRGAGVGYRGDPPAIVAHAAAGSGNVEVLEALLGVGMSTRLGARGGDGVPDSNGIPLIIASVDHPEFFRRLIQARADINVTNPRGETALIVATKDGNDAAVQLLLQFRVQIDVGDRGERTALMFAAEGGQEEILRQLLIAGAATRTRDAAGNTPLHFAAQSGTPEVVRILLTAGADVNATNAAGDQPIDVAQSNPSSVEITDILIASGATTE